MKSLKTFLNKNTSFFPTKKWMEEIYDDFNKKYFKNKLPKIQLTIQDHISSFWKDTYAITNFSPDSANKTVKDLEIRLMTFHKGLNERDWQEIMIHEMVHVDDYVTNDKFYSKPFYQRGQDYNDSKEGHTGYFEKKAEELNKQGWHIGQYAPDEVIKKSRL